MGLTEVLEGSVYNILKKLRENGRIDRTGSRRDGRWVIRDDEPQEIITVYGMPTCPDCTAIEDQIKNDDRFRFVDIGADVKRLREFMKLRDNMPEFDTVKSKGIGIPCFIRGDGSVTLDPMEVGLIPQETQGKACRIDGNGC